MEQKVKMKNGDWRVCVIEKVQVFFLLRTLVCLPLFSCPELWKAPYSSAAGGRAEYQCLGQNVRSYTTHLSHFRQVVFEWPWYLDSPDWRLLTFERRPVLRWELMTIAAIEIRQRCLAFYRITTNTEVRLGWYSKIIDYYILSKQSAKSVHTC